MYIVTLISYMLSQAVTQNQKVRVFFLLNLSAFFSNPPQIIAVVDKIVLPGIPHEF